jgi:hypothetical protein
MLLVSAFCAINRFPPTTIFQYDAPMGLEKWVNMAHYQCYAPMGRMTKLFLGKFKASNLMIIRPYGQVEGVAFYFTF